MAESPVSTPRTWSRFRIQDIVALTAIVGLAIALATIWKESSETAKQVRLQTVSTETRIRQLWQDMLYEFGAVPDQGAIYDANYNSVGIIVEESFDGYRHDRSCRFQVPVADDSAPLQQAMDFVIPRLFRGHQWQPALEKTREEVRKLRERSTSNASEIQEQFELNGIEVQLTIESDEYRRELAISMSL